MFVIVKKIRAVCDYDVSRELVTPGLKHAYICKLNYIQEHYSFLINQTIYKFSK